MKTKTGSEEHSNGVRPSDERAYDAHGLARWLLPAEDVKLLVIAQQPEALSKAEQQLPRAASLPPALSVERREMLEREALAHQRAGRMMPIEPADVLLLLDAVRFELNDANGVRPSDARADDVHGLERGLPASLSSPKVERPEVDAEMLRVVIAHVLAPGDACTRELPQALAHLGHCYKDGRCVWCNLVDAGSTTL